MNVPALRFKEFSDKWQVFNLEELSDVTTGNKDTQNRLDDGEFPFFVRSQTVEKINSYAYDGEAVLTSGDGVGVGKNFHYINGKFDYHQRVYCIFNFKSQVSGKYIFYYFSEKFNKRVMGLSAKNSVDSVRRSMITEMPISIPTLSEQTKIANFLTAIDEKISLLTQKHDLLTQYKKGVMQQIFSQELRFKDDGGGDFPEWEEATLGEIGKFKSGTGFSDSEQGGTSGIPFYKVSDMNLAENKLEMLVANNYVSDDQISKMKYKVISDEAIVFAKVGAAIFLERKRKAKNFLIDNNMMAFIPSCQINFIKHFMDSIRLSKFAQVGALPSYNASDLSIIEISVPCIKEQTKIANFLTAIDDKINVTQTQLQAVKQYKQGLLQQMFV